ncbi:MAG: 50S ribosomal protein L4 [Oscillospiraceae bacterium]|nr:50S ribosomal protein L4 [Oscillospiraceae bacterium]
MANIDVFDMSGAKVSTMDLADSIFCVNVNEAAMHMAVTNYLANQRQGTQSALTRAEVSGGGIKPWRQKGTGRARQGSTRAPQWTHGGIVFAPKPRDYRFSMNKKVKKLALLSAISSKLAEGKLIVLDKIEMNEYKTKTVVGMLNALKVENALVVNDVTNLFFVKSAKNIPGVKAARVNTINTYEILKHDTLILTQDAVKKLEEVYA